MKRTFRLTNLNSQKYIFLMQYRLYSSSKSNSGKNYKILRVHIISWHFRIQQQTTS